MTVSTEVNHEQYTGNGTTSVFPFRFRILKDSHLAVTVSDLNGVLSTLTIGKDYTITGTGLVTGGNVILANPLPDGWQISLDRDLPAVQETDLRNQGKFFAETHEDAFDYLTMLVQRLGSLFGLALRKPSWIAKYYDAQGNRLDNLADPVKPHDAVTKGYSDAQFGRTLRVPESSVNLLPVAPERSNKLLAFNNSGQPMAVLPQSGSATDVMIELAKPTGAGSIGTTSGKAVQQELNEFGSTAGAGKVNASDGRTVQQWLIALDSAEFRDKNISYLARINYKARRKQAINIVCQGDSMTAGYDVTSTDVTAADGGDNATHASITYPARLGSFLTQQSGIPVSIIKQGRSGQTAKQGYQTWANNPGGDLVFLMYGINDSWEVGGATHDEYMQYMELLIRRYISWGHGVVVMTCAAAGSGEGNPLYQMYAQEIRDMASVYGCATMDAHEVVYNFRYGQIDSSGVHFNSAGYSKLGEACAAMIMAGGLLKDYRPVSSEHHVWPGKQSSSVGYYDANNNIGTTYSANAYTLQGITGTLSANAPSIMSYSFYLDAEAAEVEVTGSWSDQNLTIVMTQNTPDGTTTRPGYYDNVAPRSSVLANTNAIQTGSYPLRNRGAALDGLPKSVGSLIGRGWKTITIFSNLTSGAPNNNYIQGVTIRPVPVSFAQQRYDGNVVKRGIDEVYTVQVPHRSFNDTDASLPAAVALTVVTIPLPRSMYGISFNNGSQYVDCGIAELTLRSASGTVSGGILKAIISKPGTGTALAVTETFRNNTNIPSVTAKIKTLDKSVVYAASSVAQGMPQREIAQAGSTIDAIQQGSYGRVLELTFTGTGTAYWYLEVRSATVGTGTAIGSAF